MSMSIKSLSNGFLLTRGYSESDNRFFPKLSEALESILNSCESFGGYTDTKYTIQSTMRTNTPDMIGVNVDISRIDRGYLLGVAVNSKRSEYGYSTSAEMIKKIYSEFYKKRCSVSVDKEIKSSRPCPGGPEVTKRSEHVIDFGLKSRKRNAA